MESMYYKWSKNGNKMIINSGFKEFDKQTNCITSGNVMANTMWGKYIRTWNEIECNGLIFKEGELFKSDLKYFHISEGLKEYIKSLNKQVVLYEFFIYRNGKKDIIGWLIEDNGTIINTCVAETRGNYEKRFLAIDMAKKIIEEKNNYVSR